MHTTHQYHGDRPSDGPDPDDGSLRLTLPTDRRSSPAGARATSTGWGDEAGVGEMCDRHGAALLSLACAIMLDGEQAEKVVVEIIAAACTGPVDDFASRSVRHNLARRTYLRCIESLTAAGTGEPCVRAHDEGAAAAMTKLRDIARQQRASVVLIMMGDHTAPDVARLLGLTPARVVALLSSCVGELRTADGHSRQRDIPGPTPAQQLGLNGTGMTTGERASAALD